MFKSLTEFFGGKKTEPVTSIEDVILGKMHFMEGDSWGARVTIAGKRIGFSIRGDATGPDTALLAHAHDIVKSFADFENMISVFLADEGRRMNMTSDQIRQFEIEEVILHWPERPDDGMIYFRGLEDIGLWRCDYINRKPKGLGFDD
jgi:hypothetical protein